MIKDIREKNENVKPNSREIEVLKNNFPACFDKEGNFDIDKFKSTISASVDITEENYGLNFLGKNYAKLISALDTETVIEPDKKHNELAGNKDSKNLYITGDNLDVLKHLTKSYAGSIDVIYIDPPYNTGNDGFIYNDRFKYTADELVEKLNISEDRANKILDFTSKGSASHSAWLAFMYPRLYIARDLLSDNGVIFISIDDNEQAQLKLLCDDVFGEENFISDMIWFSNVGGRSDAKYIATTKEYILMYAKNIACTAPLKNKRIYDKDVIMSYSEKDEISKYKKGLTLQKGGNESELNDRTSMGYSIYYNPEENDVKVIDETFFDANNNCCIGKANEKLLKIGYYRITPAKKANGAEGRWRWGKDRFLQDYKKEIIFEKKTDGTYMCYTKDRIYNDYKEEKNKDYILEKEMNTASGTREVSEIFNDKIFDYPKPAKLIKYLINLADNKDITVLDFFSGSGTTGQAVMELNAEDGGNRKFILVQLPEAVESKEYKTIDEIGRKRIELSAQKIKKEHPEYTGDLGFKHYTVKEVDADTIANMEEFDPNKNVVNIGDVITDDTIITTWLCADGYGIDADICKIDLAGYSAYMCENHLYLIDAGFKEEHLNALMKRIIEDPEFNIKYIVLFGYNFNDWSINEMMEKNTKVIKNSNKALNIDILTRF